MAEKKTVEAYLAKQAQWQAELTRLRGLVLECGLDETVKWGAPCYTLKGKNVVGLSGFKSYFGLWFYEGVSLPDPAEVFINAQEGKTKHMRQWRMQHAGEIKDELIRTYVRAAADWVRQGGSNPPAPPRSSQDPVDLNPYLRQALESNAEAKQAYEQLTPGRQREYVDYISDAKREATQIKRVEKILPMIAKGQGLNDRYR